MNKPRDRVRAALRRCKQTERHDMPSSSPAKIRFTAVSAGLQRRGTVWLGFAMVAAFVSIAAHGQTMKAPDITRTPTLYVIPYAHLDTQWRWEFPQTISQFLLKTMRVNFDYMDKWSARLDLYQ